VDVRSLAFQDEPPGLDQGFDVRPNLLLAQTHLEGDGLIPGEAMTAAPSGVLEHGPADQLGAG
jgi:hypothetical protein